jgi:hypothetical protein
MLAMKTREVAAERELNQQSREPNPTVQMSIRMPADVYDQFRGLCMVERRKNGEMLSILLEDYLAQAKDEPGE